MDISYDHYKIFYYVAKLHGFTKAANALYANQPNVTRAVKNLEKELGCALFVRANRNVTLTPEGETLYAHVKIAVEHIQAAEEQLLLENHLQRGMISVGATENALHYVLLPVLKKFRTLHPQIRIKVTNHSTLQALEALKNGLIDFAVVTAPLQFPNSLQAFPIRSYEDVAVCSRAFSELAHKKVTLKELSAYPVISLSSESATFALYAELFAKEGVTLSPDIEAATTDQIMPMVLNDLGVGFLPEYFVRSEPAREKLCILDLTPPLPKRSICLFKRVNEPLSVAAKELEKLLLTAQKETFA